MTKKSIKATKLVVGLPFELGKLEFEPDETQQKAAWELYVELSTRIAVQLLRPDEGNLHEALTSLYSLFEATRGILREAGPAVARGRNSVGAVAIEVLNIGLRPFLAKWHPLLEEYEAKRTPDVSLRDHERKWELEAEFRKELNKLREQMIVYAEALAKIASVDIGK